MSLIDFLLSGNGRISRSSWWYYTLPATIITLGSFLVSYLLKDSGYVSVFVCLSTLLALVLIYPTFMVSIKRCHDRNRSGWFLLWLYIPLLIFMTGSAFYFMIAGVDLTRGGVNASLIFLMALLCICNLPPLWVFIDLGFLPGTSGPNKFGPDPLMPSEPSSRPPRQVSDQTPVQPVPRRPPDLQTGVIPPDLRPPAVEVRPVDFKYCPGCAEAIEQDAAFCKYCGREQTP